MPAVVEICGTYARYKQGGCRCAPCTAAFMRAVPHGTASGYRYHGCRCESCKASKRAAAKLERGAPERAPTPTVEEIAAELIEYVRVTGNVPLDTDECPRLSRKWGALRKIVTRAGSNFTTLLGRPAVVCRALTTSSIIWTRDLIADEAQRYADLHGKWPSTHDGAVDAFGGRSWMAAHRWLLTQGTSLAALAQDFTRPLLEYNFVPAPPVPKRSRQAHAPKHKKDPEPFTVGVSVLALEEEYGDLEGLDVRETWSHGDYKRYKQGCKCNACKVGWQKFMAARISDKDSRRMSVPSLCV